MAQPGMQNLNDTEPGGLLTAADFERRITPTRRTLAYRIRRIWRIAVLRLWIWCDEDWIRDANRAGIFETAQLKATATNLQELRIRLAIEEAS